MELTNDFRVGVPVERAYAVLTDVERIAPCLPGAELQEIEGDEYRGVVKVKVGPITASYQGAATFVERTAPNRVVLRAEGRETRGQGNATATITATLTPDGDGTTVTVVTDLTITGRVAQFGRGVLADVSGKLLGQFVECLESTVLAGPEPVVEAAAATAVPTPSPVEAPAPEPVVEPAEPVVAEPVVPEPVVEAPVTDEPAAPVDAPVVATVEPEPVDGEAVEPAPAAAAEVKPAVRRIESAPAQPVDLVATAGSPVAKRAAPVVGAIAVLWLLRVLLRRRRR